MKKLLVVLLSLGLCLSLCLPAFAEEIETSGTCGEDMTWEYEDGTLYIDGTGAMDDFEEDAPWAYFRDEIEYVELSGEIEYIGANAFTDYDTLKRVEFGGSLQEIGTKAFKSCDGLTSVTLPGGFRRFGEESFMSCANLTEIHCNGGMPSFNLNCLWDTYAKIYFPVNNPWPLVHIEQLESAFQGRIEFLAEDGTDPYVPPVETESAATEPVETEPETIWTEPEETEAVTEPVEESTVPVTEAETEPVVRTEEPTTLPTEMPTEMPAERPAEVPEKTAANGIWMGLFLITGTLSLVLLGALIFRRRRW